MKMQVRVRGGDRPQPLVRHLVAGPPETTPEDSFFDIDVERVKNRRHTRTFLRQQLGELTLQVRHAAQCGDGQKVALQERALLLGAPRSRRLQVCNA